MKPNTSTPRNEDRVKIELNVLLLEVLGHKVDPDAIESDESLDVISEFIDDVEARESVEYCVRETLSLEDDPEDLDWNTGDSQITLRDTLRAIGNERYLDAFEQERGTGDFNPIFVRFITEFAELRTEQEIESRAA